MIIINFTNHTIKTQNTILTIRKACKLIDNTKLSTNICVCVLLCCFIYPNNLSCQNICVSKTNKNLQSITTITTIDLAEENKLIVWVPDRLLTSQKTWSTSLFSHIIAFDALWITFVFTIVMVTAAFAFDHFLCPHLFSPHPHTCSQQSVCLCDIWSIRLSVFVYVIEHRHQTGNTSAKTALDEWH